ncbi:MAG TPA: M1 family metallopeptidase [Cyclobacteriaceae bacterium]|nr:M1 family metallopeptidase [Cyclobacteriaceae bacterium]
MNNPSIFVCRAVAFVLSFSVSFLPGFTQIQENLSWGGPIDPLQQKVTIEHYELELEVFPESKRIAGFLKVRFDCGQKLDTLRLNLLESYEVTRVEIYDEPVKFRHVSDTLDVFIPDGCATAATIYYEGPTPIAKNPPWDGGFTWERDGLGNHWMGLSAQNEGAKIFMPCLDHPSSKASNGVDLFITVPAPYFVAANGRLVHQEKIGEKIAYHWSTDYPISNYNINFTVGIFHQEQKSHRSTAGEEIPMMVYTLEENKDKAPMLLSVLETSLNTHEKYFGAFPFPNDKIAVVETPYLGMEHQTINAYGNNFQFVPMGEAYYDWLLHHELGHEWWGNKVTVGDWADYWIHEGICTYGDWLFYLEHGGEDAYQEKVNAVARTIPNKQPIVAPENATSDEAYHSEVYSKGAYVIHSLRFILGDELFFPMLRSFLADERFTYSNLVDTGDFVAFVQQFSGRDLKGFFNMYLYTNNLPEIRVRKKGKNRYFVEIPNIDFFIPMAIDTSDGIVRVELSADPVIVESSSPITVDPEGWFLKR